MKALITLGVVALIVLGVALVAWILTRSEKARQDRRERKRHEAFLNRLRSRAITDSAVDPTSAVFADEIGNHLANKETSR